MKFYIKNTGDTVISIRDKNCECVLLKPGEDCESESFPGNENIVLTPDGQPHAIAVLGGYN